MGKTITLAVVNQKGGVGKTTTSVNLAAILAKTHGKRVLLVDMDPQGHATAHLGHDPDELMGVHDVMLEGKSIADVVESTSIEGLDLVPAPEDDTDIQLQGKPGREFFLRKALSKTDEYDFVVIDAPPHLSVLMFNALVACDQYIIAIYPEGASVRGIAKLERTAQALRDIIVAQELRLLGVLPCRVDPRLKLTQAVLSSLKGAEGLPIFTTMIRANVRLSEAFTRGVPVIESDPDSNGAKDYVALAAEVLEKINAG